MTDEHLTHGWEPDLPADDSLLRRFVLANAERNAFVASSARGRAQRWDDLAAADPASPVLFDNAAVLLQPPAYTSVDDAVERCSPSIRPSGTSPSCRLGPRPTSGGTDSS